MKKVTKRSIALVLFISFGLLYFALLWLSGIKGVWSDLTFLAIAMFSTILGYKKFLDGLEKDYKFKEWSLEEIDRLIKHFTQVLLARIICYSSVPVIVFLFLYNEFQITLATNSLAVVSFMLIVGEKINKYLTNLEEQEE